MVKSFVSGGFGGACLVFVGHPLDLIKTRLQTMVVKPGQAPMYTGALDCARKTIKFEGVSGTAPPLFSSHALLACSPCVLCFGTGARLVQGHECTPDGCDTHVGTEFPCL